MSVISAQDVEAAKGELVIGPRDILTPLARDRAKELKIAIRVGDAAPVKAAPAASPAPPAPPAKPPPPAAPVAKAAPPPPQMPLPQSGILYRRGEPLPAALRPSSVRAATADARPRVGVVGAGHVGATTALRLADTDLFSEIVLVDLVPGLAAGLALDLWHGANLRGFTTRIEGSTELEKLAGVDYVVVTAGRPRKPNMSRTDLTNVNAEIIRAVAEVIRQRAPDAVVVVVTNPLEEMTHLTAKVTGFPPERVIGMAGVLDTARFCSLVGLTGVARPDEVLAYALGSHGPEMVIPLSLATARGTPLDKLIDPPTLAAIVERTRDSGAEVVKLLQTGSAYFSPAESAVQMVRAMVQGSQEILTACVQSKAAYGLADTRVGLPVRLGKRGVKEIVNLPLKADELDALRAAAARIDTRIREIP